MYHRRVPDPAELEILGAFDLVDVGVGGEVVLDELDARVWI